VTTPNSESPVPRHNGVSDDPWTKVIFDEGEGDTTIRPIPPERLAQAMAERDLIQKWQSANNRKQRQTRRPRKLPSNRRLDEGVRTSVRG
jgi:hypothetical protein